MKPGPRNTGAVSRAAAPSTEDPSQSRRVRLFVALHLGAVGAIYALAVAIAGLAGPSMPPVPVAMAVHEGAPPATRHAAAVPATPDAGETPAPAWTQTAEVAPPWALR